MSFNEMINKKHKSFTILEVLTIIAILAMITTTSYIKVGNILDKPKDLEITRDLKQYEDAAISLTAQGSDFTVDNINNAISDQLQLVSAEDGKVNSYNKNPYGESYRVDIIDKDNFTVTSPKVKNGESISSIVLKISRVNGKVTSSYTNGGAVPVTPEGPKYAEGALVMEIVTTTANKVFEVPAYGPYNLTVDWGDGSVKQTVTTALTTLVKVPHTYTNPGTYTVTISGTSERVVYDGVASRVYITKILQFGNIIKSNAAGMFANCTNLTSIEDTLEGTSITNTESMFRGCTKLVTIPTFMLKDLSISNANFMFQQCTNLKTVPEDFFNGCKRIDIPYGTYGGIFRDTSITELPENILRGYQGQNFVFVFEGMSKLKSINKNMFKETGIINSEFLFYRCTSLEKVPEGLFEESKLTKINGMFQECYSLNEIPKNLFKGLSISSGNYVFLNCTSLKTVPGDIFYGCKKFDIPYGTYGGIFRGTGITEIPREIFRGYEGISVSFILEGMKNLNKLPSSLFEGTNITTATMLFYDCTSITEIPYEFFEGSRLKVINNMFNTCRSLNKIPEDLFSEMSIENGNNVFSDCTALREIPDDLFNGCKKFEIPYGTFGGIFRGTSISEIPQFIFRGYEGTNVSFILEGMKSLNKLPSNLFNGTNISTATMLFYDCSALTEVPENFFSGSRLKVVNGMFNICKSLNKIPSNLFNGINITNGNNIFAECTALKELPDDLFYNCLGFEIPYGTYGGPFRGTGVTHLPQYILRGYLGNSTAFIFEGMKNLTTISGEIFSDTNITNSSYMFYQSSNLSAIPNTLFKDSKVNNTSGMFLECTSISEIPAFLFKDCNIGNASFMFKDCTNLTKISDDIFNGCKGINISYGTFGGIFRGTSIKHIPRYVFRGYEGTKVVYLFDGMGKLETIDEDVFKGTNITNAEGVFFNCKSIESIPNTLFTGTSINRLVNAFRDCTALTQVPELWTNEQFTSYNYCFYGCTTASNYASIPTAWK